MCLPRCGVSLRGIVGRGRGVGMSGDGLFFGALVYAVYPPLSCRTSPPQGGDRQEALPPLHSQTLRWVRPRRRSISPLEGEMPGRAEGGEAAYAEAHQWPQQAPSGRYPACSTAIAPSAMKSGLASASSPSPLTAYASGLPSQSSVLPPAARSTASPAAVSHIMVRLKRG
ncbi:hypothetical protein At1D1609_25310 [Agrobacterium tumefaciens]|uniref:Uncharacterized protein n=1 Tax=Agrobacterium tumefaciens TaxID=358 RepID=A0A2L2LE26_AGRTU|nr:hypothetical protein At1D1609_25310 [Agrobacterium tumefaciens]